MAATGPTAALAVRAEGPVAAARPPRRRDFPGWRMVWVLSVTETIGYAALFYCFAVMVLPMRTDLGASTGQVSAALSIALGVGGAAAPFVGRWVDRHGARWLMTAGSLLGAASVLAWSQARSLPQLYVAFVGVGLAGAAVLYEPAFAVVNAWFDRRRREALLTMTVVAGFSSTIFVPASQALADRYGWRTALVVLAVLVGACAVPHAVVLRRAPEDLGLAPDGVVHSPAPTHSPALTHSQALPRGAPPARPASVGGTASVEPAAHAASAAVRWLTTSAVLHAVAVTVVAVHLVAYLRDGGTPTGLAAAAAGALGVMSVAGRVAFTALTARRGAAPVAAALVVGQGAGVAALLTLPAPAGLVAFVVLFGAGSGVMTIARPALLGGYVTPARFAAVSGYQAMVTTVGRVGAPLGAGAVITAVGYGSALLAVAACSLAAGAGLLLAGRVSPRPRESLRTR